MVEKSEQSPFVPAGLAFGRELVGGEEPAKKRGEGEERGPAAAEGEKLISEAAAAGAVEEGEKLMEEKKKKREGGEGRPAALVEEEEKSTSRQVAVIPGAVRAVEEGEKLRRKEKKRRKRRWVAAGLVALVLARAAVGYFGKEVFGEDFQLLGPFWQAVEEITTTIEQWREVRRYPSIYESEVRPQLTWYPESVWDVLNGVYGQRERENYMAAFYALYSNEEGGLDEQKLLRDLVLAEEGEVERRVSAEELSEVDRQIFEWIKEHWEEIKGARYQYVPPPQAELEKLEEEGLTWVWGEEASGMKNQQRRQPTAVRGLERREERGV